MMLISNLSEAQKFLFSFIPKGKKNQFPAELGLKRAQHLMKLLGNPQEKIKIIHLAGSSGKGSTCFILSQLLKSHHFKVGLHLSPHLLDIRERCQINNQLINEKKFCYYLNQLLPTLELMEKSPFGKASYFEILVALAFNIFYQEKVDYAVIETGLGGLYDGTNVIKNKNKVSVINKIGFDHINILGRTLSLIAYQKGMIMTNNSVNFSINQKKSAQKILQSITKKKNAHLTFINKNIHYKILNAKKAHQSNFKENENSFKLEPNQFLFHQKQLLTLSLLGQHQVENCSLSLETFIYLAKRDNFKINWPEIKTLLTNLHFMGRGEIKNFSKHQIIIDGAHNPQKIKALLALLEIIWPNKKINFVLGFKKGKEVKKMLKLIIKKANKIYLTNFFAQKQDLIQLSVDPKDIAEQLKELGFNNYQIFTNHQNLITQLLNDQNNFCLTGSLYLLADIYHLLQPNFTN